MAKQHFPFLDGFRAIGILMILGHHLCVGLDLYHVFDNDPPVLTWLFFNSWKYLHCDLSPLYLFMQHVIDHFKGILGVQLFLIISGFLITRILFDMSGTWSDVGRFWVRRFFRIYPAYALMVIVSLSIFAWQSKSELADMTVIGLRYLLFMQNYFPRNVYLEHAWTLAIFEQFYLIYPVIIMIIYRSFNGIEVRRKVLMAILVMLMFLGAWVKYSYLVLGKPLISWPFTAPFPYFTLTYHLGSLGLGCLLAVSKPYWRDVPKNSVIGGILWIIGVTGYCILFFVIDWGYSWGHWYINIFGYLSSLSLLAAAFLGVSFIARLKYMQWLGRHSYGIYLWHILVISFCAQGLRGLPPTLVVFGALAACIGAGVISTMTIERFFLKLREGI